MKAWRALLFLLLLVWSAAGLSARPSKSFFVFPGYDSLGSVRYLTDPSGVITDTFTYDAFGILIDRRARNTGGTLVPFANPALETPPVNTTPAVNNYRYTGEQWDPDLGMYYLRARYYHPQLGRFWTMDTFEGNNQDPLSLHKYLYCHANPVNGTDPSGREVMGQLGTTSIMGAMARTILPAVARGGARAVVSVGRTGVRLGFASTQVVDPVAMLLARNGMVSEAALIAAAAGLAAAPTLLEIEEFEEEAKGQIVYRAMRGDRIPTVGDASALELGVRDSDVLDIVNGVVQPTPQGMSVTPDFPAFLPTFALKAVAGGKAKVWGYHLGIMDPRLTYRPDPKNPRKHGFIGVTSPMPLFEYRNLIHAMQPAWVSLQP